MRATAPVTVTQVTRTTTWTLTEGQVADIIRERLSLSCDAVVNFDCEYFREVSVTYTTKETT